MTTRTEGAAEAVFGLLPPIFRECVEPESYKFDLSVPRPIGGHIYASNGRIAVRVAATPEVVAAIPPLAEGKKFPRVDSVFAGETGWESTPTPLPDLSDGPVCRRCRGAGSFPERQCSRCHGGGEIECPHCAQDMECDECCGKGCHAAGPCWHCGGSGVEDGRQEGRALGNGFTLSWSYIALLHRHGATLYLPAAASPEVPARFVVGGVEGVVMGLADPAPAAREVTP